VNVAGAVYDYANPAFSQTGGDGTLGAGSSPTTLGNSTYNTVYNLAFGTFSVGSGTKTATLSLGNGTISNALYQDLLNGSVSLTGSAFGQSGWTFSNISAGASQGGLNITFNTSTAGSYTGSLTFAANSVAQGGSGLSDASLGNIVINLSGTVTGGNSIGLTVNGGPGLGRTDVGDVTTGGSNGSYETITTTNLSSVTSGYEDVLGSYPTPTGNGPAYVLLDLTVPDGGNVQTFLSSLSLDSGSYSIASVDTTSADFLTLKNYYDAKFGKTFDGMLIFNPVTGATAGNLDVSWNFTTAGWGVNAVAVVPEPTSFGLIGVGAMGLLSGRRRRNRR
jgi:hypothetical protein